MDIKDIIRDKNYDGLMDDISIKIQYCWHDCIKKSDIEEWLNNFTGKVFTKSEEEILALMLLNNFIYITHDEVMHLCRVMYYEYVHTITSNGEDYNEVLKQTKFYPIGNPSESSSLILYFFRMANGIGKDKFAHYPRDANRTNRVVFIDDISGSGQQASDVIKEYIRRTTSDNKYINYYTLIGTEVAEEVFRNMDINYRAACLLDGRMKLFSDDSYTKFSDQERKILSHFIDGYRDEVNWEPMGYKSSQIAIGFYYNVPDNCIPIFWSEFNGWKSLFKRFHKKYNTSWDEEVFNDRVKFI